MNFLILLFFIFIIAPSILYFFGICIPLALLTFSITLITNPLFWICLIIVIIFNNIKIN